MLEVGCSLSGAALSGRPEDGRTVYAPSSNEGMPVPARPQRMVILSAAASSLVVRRFAPIGKSSSSLSPSAKGPWQSAHPDVFHVCKPAFSVASSWARPALAQARAATARTSTTPRVPLRALAFASSSVPPKLIDGHALWTCRREDSARDIESTGETEGEIRSMRNHLDKRVLRRAWTESV